MARNIVNKVAHDSDSKNIVSGMFSRKDVVVPEKTEEVKEAKKTLSDFSAFVTKPIHYDGVFSNDLRLVSVFESVDIFSDKNIPKTVDELVKIKGIGAKTTSKIVKRLNKK